MKNQLKTIIDTYDIEEKNKEQLLEQLFFIYEKMLHQEKQKIGERILQYFNYYPKIEDKEDLTLFLDDIQEFLEVDLTRIEKTM